MKKLILLSVLHAALSVVLLGQAAPKKPAYEIKVTVKDYPGDSLVLAYKLGSKNYIKDTTACIAGKAVFSGDKPLEGGIYLVLMPPDNKYFEVLVNPEEQFMTFETTGPNYVEAMKVKGSKDNELFYDYMRFLSAMNAKATPWRMQTDTLRRQKKEESPEYQKAVAELELLDKDVKARQSDIATQYPNTLCATIIKINQAVDIPEPPADIKGKKEKEDEFRYYFYKGHFFDGLNWEDERLVRTPFIEQKIGEYLEKLTVSHPDSMIVACDFLLEKARKNKEIYKFCASWLLNHFAASKIICMDRVYVHLADKYYCDKKGPFGGAFWVDQEQLDKICKNANELRPVRCGELAPNLILNTLDGKQVELHKIKAEYVIVYFWDPDCGNCKKQSAKLVELYDQLKARGVEIFGICSKSYEDFDKCLKKAEELNMKWINTGDPYYQARAKQLYDIKMTPFIYLLDKDKKILFKRLEADQVLEVLDKEAERRKKEAEKK
jgi:peroxiredoxin